MTADALAPCVDRASAATALIWLSQIIVATAPKG